MAAWYGLRISIYDRRRRSENRDETAIVEAWVAAVGTVAAAGIGAYASSQAASKAANAEVAATNAADQTQEAEFVASAGLNTPTRNLAYGADSLLANLFGLPDPNSSTTTSMYGANSSLDALGGNQSAAPTNASSSASNGTGSGGTATGNGSSQGNMAASAINGINLGTQTTNTASNGSPTTSSAQGQFSNFYNSPGYQFALQQGQQAVTRGAAATGSLYSTNTLNQLDQNAQGYASQQYNNYVNQLMGLAGYGSTGVSATSSAATTAGNNISANQLSAGNAQASGILGQAGAFTGAINNSAGILGNYATLANNQSTPSGGGNPLNLGGSTSVAPSGSSLTYDQWGNITGSTPNSQ